MKIAIAAQSSTPDALIDKHFGQCSCFFIYDDENKTTEVIDNPALGMQGCKGETILKELLVKGIKRVIAGDFGTNVQQLFNKHQIQMILYPDKKTLVSEIIELLTQKDN